MSRRWTAGLLAGALTIFAAACGDDTEVSSEPSAPVTDSTAVAAPPSTGAAPDSTVEMASETGPAGGTYAADGATGRVELDARPERIVVLAPTHTETLFAIGAGDQVIAVDDQSNYPEEALAVQTDLSGFEPNVEAIASYDPDLVVIGTDTVGLAEQLGALDVPVWSGPGEIGIDEAYEQIEQLGALTGNADAAEELVSEMRMAIEQLQAAAPEFEAPVRFFHEVDATLYSATSDTFIGQIYSLLGLENIADAAADTSPYPQLSAEFVIDEDPELIFLADADYGESPDTVAARPGWNEISAVRKGLVIPVDADISSRWGPRIVDYVRAVGEALHALAEAQPVG